MRSVDGSGFASALFSFEGLPTSYWIIVSVTWKIKPQELYLYFLLHDIFHTHTHTQVCEPR